MKEIKNNIFKTTVPLRNIQICHKKYLTNIPAGSQTFEKFAARGFSSEK